MEKKRRPGRPLRGQQKRQRVSYTLNPHQVLWLQRQSALSGRSQSDILDEVLQQAQDLFTTKKGKRPPPSPFPHIPLSQKKLHTFCRKHHIKKLAFFGSVLRNDFGPASDVDVLVEFDPEHVPGLSFFSIEEELSKILGHKVDLNTPEFLSQHFRHKVLSEAWVHYARQ